MSRDIRWSHVQYSAALDLGLRLQAQSLNSHPFMSSLLSSQAGI